MLRREHVPDPERRKAGRTLSDTARKPLEQLTPGDIARAIGGNEPTDAQADVIAGPMEPTLVVAGAGAGKTETMAARVVYLVATRRARPGQILGLTFTRKAAQQLSRRVQMRLDEFARSHDFVSRGDEVSDIAEAIRTEQPRISTYDSYAGDVLSSHGLLIPVEPDATVINETDLYILVHSIVSEWDRPFPWSVGTVVERVIALAEQISGHLITTDDVRGDEDLLSQAVESLETKAAKKDLQTAAAAQEDRLALLDVVDAVHERLRSEGKLTFGMRMSYAAQLSSRFPEVVDAERRLTSVVLLDEYQDTGQAQRVMLASLFGGGERQPLAVTAVGDPMQSIYGWRGASASNLDSFLTDFPRAKGQAYQRNLSTSWRNPPEVLTLANSVTAQLRNKNKDSGATVPVLEPKNDSERGDVRLGVFATVDDERGWVASRMAGKYRRYESDHGKPPSAAVLVRRNADAEPLARALRAEGLEVEVLSSGGLLDVPEISDVLALMRVAVNPGDDEASMRLLAGDRFRLGAADLAALHRRAQEISHRPERSGEDEAQGIDKLRADFASLAELENIDNAGLADAAHNPGARGPFTAEGRAALADFDAVVAAVRDRLDQGPAHVLSVAENALGLDVEVRVRAKLGKGEGRQQLDTLARRAADFASNPDASVQAFLDYLHVARGVERGLAQEIVPQDGRVQILTVHSAKGLEWDIVAVPHVVKGRFPKDKAPSNWVRNSWEIPSHLRGDRRTEANPGGVPVVDIAEATNYKELDDLLTAHINELKSTVGEEDRRLFYVALTRSKSELLVSAHHWSEGVQKPLGPSLFLQELRDTVLDAPHVATVDEWVTDPGDENPLENSNARAVWPEHDAGGPGEDPTSHAAVAGAAREVASSLPVDLGAFSESSIAEVVAAAGEEFSDPLTAAWLSEALIHIRQARHAASDVIDVEIPSRLTATQHVALERDPASFAVNVMRPMPQKPNQFARRGTTFHAWVEEYFTAATQFLIADDELPGSGDDWEEADQQALREQFLSSHWAQKTAAAVEVPFAVSIGGQIKVGKMDAVFRDGEDWIVVDWKTGAMPGGKSPDSASARKHRQDVAIQLAIYRIAWARILEEETGTPVPLERIRGAFHYIGSGEDVYPETLPDEAELAAAFERRFAQTIDAEHVQRALGDEDDEIGAADDAARGEKTGGVGR